MRKQFTFYRSFYEALCLITDKAERADAIDAICRYALDGEPPDMEALSDTAKVVMVLIRPVLDTARRKAEGGMHSRKSPEGCEQDESKIVVRPGQDKSKMSVRCGQEDGNKGEKEKESEKEIEIEIEIETEKEIELETETEIESEGEGDTRPPAPREGGVPRRANSEHPSLEEVRAYCVQRGTGVPPEQWYDYYSANGWMVGQNPMRDWKAAVRNWERTEYRDRQLRHSKAPSPARPLSPEQRERSDRALEENQAQLRALLASVGEA